MSPTRGEPDTRRAHHAASVDSTASAGSAHVAVVKTRSTSFDNHESNVPAVTDWIHTWSPPPYQPIAWIGRSALSGHAHTLLPVVGSRNSSAQLSQTTRHLVPVSDGDEIVLHHDAPGWSNQHDTAADPAVMLVHGLCGCHAADYIKRFAVELHQLGIHTYRLDMRGCGASATTRRTITHAGRSPDIIAALGKVAEEHRQGPLGVVGVSLGGNQTLRALGRVGSGQVSPPGWWPRLSGVIAIAPPIDLQRCSDAMEAKRLRFYNHYFIRHLLKRIPPGLAANPAFEKAVGGPRPRTLRQFDRRFTAPLAGYVHERAYYEDASAMHWLDSIERSTLIVAAHDDPLVPSSMFQDRESSLSASTRLLLVDRGGHNGFLQRGRRAWTDDVVGSFFRVACDCGKTLSGAESSRVRPT